MVMLVMKGGKFLVVSLLMEGVVLLLFRCVWMFLVVICRLV